MSIGIKFRNHLKRLTLLSGVLAFFMGSAVMMDQVFAKTSDEKSATDTSGHIISIYDRGEERVIVTKAKTVREALEVANIEVNDQQDVIEPALDSELIASKYNVNIYRARPVTIVDGMVKKRVTTAHQTPERIAEAAGMKLYSEDRVSTEVAGELLLHGADKVLKIDRATSLEFTLYGKKAEVRTRAATVGEFLKEKEITMAENDTLSVSESTPITPGMSIELWREGKQTVTVEEEVDFAVEQIQDANREVGYRSVQTPGEKGTRNVTYEIEMKNGQEVNRTEIASITTKEPKRQLETVGTKPKTVQYNGGGNKDTWLAASNIPQDQWGYADYLVQRESGWNPNAVNSSSGACGLGQQLPCGKWAGAWNDPVAGLNGMQGYVMSRYGSWAAAVAHSQSRGWY